MKRVVIIGAGIAGLSAAYSLIEHGAHHWEAGLDLEVVILEKIPPSAATSAPSAITGI